MSIGLPKEVLLTTVMLSHVIYSSMTVLFYVRRHYIPRYVFKKNLNLIPQNNLVAKKLDITCSSVIMKVIKVPILIQFFFN